MRYALLFPGQGSQKLGMGSDFVGSSHAARQMFEQANQLLGYDLASLCADGPFEKLSLTEYTQPALYVTSCAAVEALRECVGVLEPVAVAGHSIGEYAALYAAGSLTFQDGLRLVRRRAELMRDAARAHPGGMAAILGSGLDVVQECCEAVHAVGVVVVANDNCPGQVVISGDRDAVDAAVTEARSRGAKRVAPLPVSGAFHSPLMCEASERLGAALSSAKVSDARIPVIANVTADFETSSAQIVANLRDQVAGRVRWRESMMRLENEQVTHCFELGSGEVLTGLMRRITSKVTALAVYKTATLDEVCRVLRADANEGD